MQEGWRCPQCGQINAPWMSYCQGCAPIPEITPYPNTVPPWRPEPYTSNPYVGDYPWTVTWEGSNAVPDWNS